MSNMFRVIDSDERKLKSFFITNNKGVLVGNLKSMMYVPMNDMKSFEVPKAFYEGTANAIIKNLNILLLSGGLKFNINCRVDFTHFVNPNQIKVVK